MRSRSRYFSLFVVWVMLTGCASSHVLIGQTRPAISPAQVKIYVRPPANYQEVAIVQASDRGAFGITDQIRMNKVISRLKKEAAALGANGILLSGVSDQAVGAVNSSSATATAYGNSAYAYGTGVSSPIMQKSGSGMAIYVPEASDEQP